MARLPRFILPGQPQHVIQRGNNREPIFCDGQDYQFFLEKLADAAQRHRIDVHAYVLMTNHVHLLLTPHTEPGIGKLMQQIGRYYVQYFNYRYRRSGTLWEGRYKAALIDAENYLLTCYRYIELNPVRAAMVGDPAEYPWSSYPANALGREDALITPHPLYQNLGDNAAERHAAYRALCQAALPEQTLADIRQATNKAWVLGGDCFKDQIAQRLNRRTQPKARGGDRRSKAYREQHS